jgi:hypothetical protein
VLHAQPKAGWRPCQVQRSAMNAGFTTIYRRARNENHLKGRTVGNRADYFGASRG